MPDTAMHALHTERCLHTECCRTCKGFPADAAAQLSSRRKHAVWCAAQQAARVDLCK